MYQIRKHQGHTWHTRNGEIVYWNTLKGRVQDELAIICENWFSVGATIEVTDEIMFVTGKSGRQLTYRISRKGL
jgi:hypothetical protein